MMLRVAFRNVLRQRRRSLLTVLTMFGGFALAAVSIGLSDGTYNNVIELFTRNQLGHVQIHAPGYLDRPSLYKNIADYEEVGSRVDAVPGVQHWAPRIKAAGLASVNDKTTGVSIIGIDPAHENETTRFDRKITEGRSLGQTAAREVVLGSGLARVLRADVGEELVVLSQGADGSIANDLYTIVGLAESNSGIQDQTTMYLHVVDAQELFVLEDRVHEIAIVVETLEDVPLVTAAIDEALAGRDVVVEPWQVFAKAFYRAMVLDQQGTWIMLGIIILLVAVGVLNTVLMTVLERRREYGVLRAIGTGPGQIFRLVLIEVTVLAVIGIVAGSLTAWAANHYFAVRGFSAGYEFTYGGIEFTRMYTEVNARTFWIPALSVMVSALLVSIYPAARAAHTPPAQAMRLH